ncbi:MAG: GNAT family N-acetyltransferase [Sorangiineae bacterium NIC37A_2]|nr:MAG: GNAT family N-acetyltransferase [Sorangiineae bacterium NIC37A_2]
MSLRVETRDGEALWSALGPLAELRIRVFREFPYLYEGSLAYEEGYLEHYAHSPRSRVVLVWDGDRVVGASTVIPLADAQADVQEPFTRAGIDLSGIDYFGESVLLREYRGRGFGVRFFELREAHALEHGLGVCAFCAVERPADHPLRPKDYVPNDAFWAKRGYEKVPELRTTLSWLDLGEMEQTAKPMTFWLKRLEGSAS